MGSTAGGRSGKGNDVKVSAPGFGNVRRVTRGRQGKWYETFCTRFRRGRGTTEWTVKAKDLIFSGQRFGKGEMDDDAGGQC